MSKMEIFANKINGFQLLTNLAKSFTWDVLQGSNYTSFQLTTNINKLFMTKLNHKATNIKCS